MLVGEQPGDQEDREGKPFVGPAGRLLDQALEKAGIDRRTAYVTNVVKHFKWTAKGKRRIHAKPNWGEIAACRPWLDAELSVVRPEVLVALGATAAQALFGKDFRVTKQRGRSVESKLAPHALATRMTATPSADVLHGIRVACMNRLLLLPGRWAPTTHINASGEGPGRQPGRPPGD